jgi:hypothetical protein
MNLLTIMKPISLLFATIKWEYGGIRDFFESILTSSRNGTQLIKIKTLITSILHRGEPVQV